MAALTKFKQIKNKSETLKNLETLNIYKYLQNLLPKDTAQETQPDSKESNKKNIETPIKFDSNFRLQVFYSSTALKSFENSQKKTGHGRQENSLHL